MEPRAPKYDLSMFGVASVGGLLSFLLPFFSPLIIILSQTTAPAAVSSSESPKATASLATTPQSTDAASTTVAGGDGEGAELHQFGLPLTVIAAASELWIWAPWTRSTGRVGSE